MIFRYSQTDWNRAKQDRVVALRRTLTQFSPEVMIISKCHLLLVAHYKGPWKMIWALAKYEARQAWWFYFGNRWEWIRVKVFRRKPDEVLREFERAAAENEALEKMVAKL